MANNVQIDITARDNASAAIGKITGALGKLGAIAGAAIVAGATALISFTAASIAAAGRVSELAIVNQVLAKNAGLSGQSVVDAAAAVKKMGIESAVSEKIVAKFVSNQLDLTKASELARVAQDAAVISGQNSTQALDGLTQGMITLQPEVLRTYGLFIDTAVAYKKFAKENKIAAENLTTAQKQQAVMNEILEKGKDIAGAYEAAMQSAGKQIRSWPRYVNDLMVAFGKPFQAAFDKSAMAVSGLLKKLAPMFEKGGEFWYLTKQMADGAEVLAERFANFLEGIDWGKVAAGIHDAVFRIKQMLNMDFPQLAAVIAKAIDNIDFSKISDGISSAIDNIDWQGLSEKMKEGVNILGKSLEDAGKEFDWKGVGSSITDAFFEAFSGQLTEKGKQFNWGPAQDSLRQGMFYDSGWTALGITIGDELFGGIENAAINLTTTFNSVYSAISSFGAKAVILLKKISQMMQAAVIPVLFTILLPNFAALAQAAYNGAAMIAAALAAGSSGGGFKGGKSIAPTTQARTPVLAGGRAAGGPVSADTSYLVGEKGPEIFTPGTRGKIIPNGMMGGVTINLTYAPAFSTASQSEFEKAITPMLNNWYRSRLTS